MVYLVFACLYLSHGIEEENENTATILAFTTSDVAISPVKPRATGKPGFYYS
jgi:hypothetical protein